MRKATPAGWKLVHIKPPTQSLFVIVTLSLHKDLLRRKLSPYQITPAFYQLVVTPFIQLGGRSTMRICPRTQHNDPKHEHMYLVWNHFCWYGHCQKVLFDVSLIFWFTSLVIRTLRNCPRTSRSDSNALTTTSDHKCQWITTVFYFSTARLKKNTLCLPTLFRGKTWTKSSVTQDCTGLIQYFLVFYLA